MVGLKGALNQIKEEEDVIEEMGEVEIVEEEVEETHYQWVFFLGIFLGKLLGKIWKITAKETRLEKSNVQIFLENKITDLKVVGKHF